VASAVENALAAYSGTTAAPHEYFDHTGYTVYPNRKAAMSRMTGFGSRAIRRQVDGKRATRRTGPTRAGRFWEIAPVKRRSQKHRALTPSALISNEVSNGCFFSLPQIAGDNEEPFRPTTGCGEKRHSDTGAQTLSFQRVTISYIRFCKNLGATPPCPLVAFLVRERQKVGGLSCKLLQNQERRWRSTIDGRGRQL